jgi:hypothetical protein
MICTLSTTLHRLTQEHLRWHSITKILRNGPRAHFPFTNEIYLIEEQYLESVVDWLAKDMEAWRWLAKRWASPEWIAESQKHRASRGTEGPRHRYGADGHLGTARRMVSI